MVHLAYRGTNGDRTKAEVLAQVLVGLLQLLIGLGISGAGTRSG